MNNAELLQKTFNGFFEDLEQKERDALQQSVDALTPLMGEDDAKIAVYLDHEIRTASRRAMAEAGAEFIRSKLNQPSLLSRALVVTPVASPKVV